MFNNAIELIEDGVFDNMDSLEMAYFHCTDSDTLSESNLAALRAKPSFAHLTINSDECPGEPCPWQSCNPPPYPAAVPPAEDEPVEAATTETVDCDKWGNQGKCVARSDGACEWVDEACVPAAPWEG